MPTNTDSFAALPSDFVIERCKHTIAEIDAQRKIRRAKEIASLRRNRLKYYFFGPIITETDEQVENRACGGWGDECASIEYFFACSYRSVSREIAVNLLALAQQAFDCGSTHVSVTTDHFSHIS